MLKPGAIRNWNQHIPEKRVDLIPNCVKVTKDELGTCMVLFNPKEDVN